MNKSMAKTFSKNATFAIELQYFVTQKPET